MRAHLILLLFLVGCSADNERVTTRPFHAVVVGQEVTFPMTLGQTRASKSVHYLTDGIYRDTTKSNKIGWYHDWHRVDRASMVDWKAPDSTHLYGISITLRGKAGQIDSVLQAIEKQFGKQISVLELKHINTAQEGGFFNDTPVYTCVPSDGIRISVRFASCWKGDYYRPCGRVKDTDPPASNNPENNLRVTVSFGLQPDEEERFASGAGRIWKDVD